MLVGTKAGLKVYLLADGMVGESVVMMAVVTAVMLGLLLVDGKAERRVGETAVMLVYP